MVAELVRRFEGGVLPKAEWNHAAHLTVALWYVTRHTPDDALTRMRGGILFLNGCHGVQNTAISGYHETLTVFWLTVVRAFAQSANPDTSVDDLAALLVAAYEDKQKLWKDYYSFDILKSQEARRTWIGPDLRSLE